MKSTNLIAIHYVMLGLAALAAGLPNLEAALPPGATPVIKAITAILVLLVAVLGAISPAATAKADGGSKTPSVPPIVGTMLSVLFAMLMVGVFAMFISIAGCSWFQSHEPQIVHAAGDVAVCVLQHDGEPVDQIVADCEGVTVSDVVEILSTAHKMGAHPDHGAPTDTDAGTEAGQ